MSCKLATRAIGFVAIAVIAMGQAQAAPVTIEFSGGGTFTSYVEDGFRFFPQSGDHFEVNGINNSPLGLFSWHDGSASIPPNIITVDRSNGSGAPFDVLTVDVVNLSTSGGDTGGIVFSDSNGNSVTVTELGTATLNFNNTKYLRFQIANTGVNSYPISIDNLRLDPVPNKPPVAVASIIVDGEDVGDSVELACENGATVQLDGTASFDPDGNDIEGEWAVADESGIVIDDPTAPLTSATFPHGVHEVTLTVYDLDENGDRKGTLDVATVSVTVFDETPPLVRISTDVAALWPANNKLHDVTICVETSDACSNPEDLQLICFMTSSQPDDSDGTGEHVGDTNGEDGFAAEVPVTLTHLGDGKFVAVVQLRAERDGEVKAGRVYSINLGVLDPAGNLGQASTAVVVPHDGRKK